MFRKEKLASLLETWSEYFVWGILFFTPIGHGGASTCLVLLALCFVVRKSMRPDFSFLKRSQNLWLLIFLLFCALSLFNSGPYLHKSFRALYAKWGQYLLAFFLFQEFLNTADRLRRMMLVALIVAGIVGLDAVLQMFRGADLFFQRPLMISAMFNAPTATFQNPNDLGSYLGVVTSFSLALLAGFQTRRSGWALLGLTLFLGSCLFLSFSRGAWLGFLCGLFLMILLSKNYKILVPAGLIFVGVMFLHPATAQRAISTVQPEGDSLRYPIWKIAMGMIQENPLLGKGLGTFMDYHGNRTTSGAAMYAHNCYLQIGAESGLFSLFAFLVFCGTVLWKGSVAYWKRQEPVLLGLLAGALAILIHSFFDTQFYSVSQAFLIWTLMGALVAASSLVDPDAAAKK